MTQTLTDKLPRADRDLIPQLERDLAEFAEHHSCIPDHGRYVRPLRVHFAINEGKQPQLHAALFELAGHLKSKNASTREACEMDGTSWVLLENLAYVFGGKGAQTVGLRTVSEIGRRLNSIHRTMRCKQIGETAVNEDVSQQMMNQVNGRQ